MSRARFGALCSTFCISLGCAAIALACSGCNDGFVSPEQPDLYKVPHRYDLGVEGDRDLSAEEPMDDMATELDMTVVLPVDLAEPKDAS